MALALSDFDTAHHVQYVESFRYKSILRLVDRSHVQAYAHALPNISTESCETTFSTPCAKA